MSWAASNTCGWRPSQTVRTGKTPVLSLNNPLLGSLVATIMPIFLANFFSFRVRSLHYEIHPPSRIALQAIRSAGIHPQRRLFVSASSLPRDWKEIFNEPYTKCLIVRASVALSTFFFVLQMNIGTSKEPVALVHTYVAKSYFSNILSGPKQFEDEPGFIYFKDVKIKFLHTVPSSPSPWTIWQKCRRRCY